METRRRPDRNDVPGEPAGDVPSSERLRAARASAPSFPNTLRPPAGEAVPPPASTSFGLPPASTPRIESLDDGWDDDDDDELEDEDAPPSTRKTPEERARARKEKARKRAERRKSRSAEAAAKQKQKQRRSKKATRSASESDDEDSLVEDMTAASHAVEPSPRKREWLTVAIAVTVFVALALFVASLLDRAWR